MALKVIEERDPSHGFNWEQIASSLEPEVKDLPYDDQLYFKSKIKFLIGKDIRLSNILTKQQMYYFLFFTEFIIMLTRYPMYVDEEYIRSQIALFLNSHGELISFEGLGWKYGPMGFQQQHVKQEIINPLPVSGGK